MVERKPDKEFLTAFREHQKGVWGDTHEDWKRIDAFEIERGVKAGRPRVKITSVRQMSAALGRE